MSGGRTRVWPPTFWARFAGLALTVALAALIEVLAHTPFRLSNPPALLILGIVFSAFSGGLRPALISTAVAWAYTAYFFSQPGQPFSFDQENLRRVALWGLTMPLTAFLVGSLNRRAARALAEAEVAALNQARLEERARAAEALRESEELYRLLAENSNDLIALVDLGGRHVYCSPSVPRLLGRDPTTAFEHVHPEDKANHRQAWEAALAGERTNLTFRYQHADGSWLWLEAWGARVEYRGQPHILGVCRDVTERKRFEETLGRNEAYLAEAQRLGRIGSWAWNVAAREFVHWSREHYRLHGLDPQKGTPSWDAAQHFIHPDDRAGCLEQIERAVQGRTDCQLEYRTVLPDGTMKYIHSISHPVFNAAGELVEFVGTEMDITERKHAEEQLRASLREKEALLKEVHHRVKNNLQLISSLLSLQAARVKDLSARQVLANSRDRVRSLALIHENLYRAGNFAEVPLGAQVQSLCAHLLRSYGGDNPRVQLKTRIADVALDLEQTVPFVLIINELVSNALKHAFPGDRAGCVSVELQGPSCGRYALIVADDGVGLPAEIDPARSGSLGLRLVGDLAQQLHGTVAVRHDGGTVFTITFDADAGGGEPR